MRTIKTTISLPEAMYVKALRRADVQHFPTFSAYVQALIREDLVLNPDTVGNMLDDLRARFQVEKDPGKREELARRIEQVMRWNDGNWSLNDSSTPPDPKHIKPAKPPAPLSPDQKS